MTTPTKRWPAQHPDRLQLYSLATPNGQKVSIALEELGLPYDAHRISIMDGDQFDPEFVAINPNSKIPALVDPDGPGGEPIAIFESGAILLYLAEKTGRLIPADPRGRMEAIEWLFFQVAGIGPMFGQFGHFFAFARGKTDTYGEERYKKEVIRLLGVLEGRLTDRDYLAGTYSVADIATVPWVKGLAFYKALDVLGYHNFPKVKAWVQRVSERPAYQAGAAVCPF